jgi:hypothetical protein
MTSIGYDHQGSEVQVQSKDLEGGIYMLESLSIFFWMMDMWRCALVKASYNERWGANCESSPSNGDQENTSNLKKVW